MIQNNTLNVKLSNLQLNKLKLGIKNGVTLNISSNVILMMRLISHTNYYYLTLRKKYPYSELFWSAFSRIQTE